MACSYRLVLPGENVLLLTMNSRTKASVLGRGITARGDRVLRRRRPIVVTAHEDEHESHNQDHQSRTDSQRQPESAAATFGWRPGGYCPGA